MSKWIAKRLRSHDEGFTLIELVVAMFITLLVMSSLLGVLVTGLSGIASSKQRQTGTALATEQLESLRARAYDSITVANGAAPAAGDPNITYSATPTLTKYGEDLIVNANVPIYVTKVVDGVSYSVSTYVTKVTPAPASGESAFNVSAFVTWSSNVSRGVRTTIQRSVLYSPKGCLSTANRPFSGPCQAYFTAQAGAAAGSISVTNDSDITQPIPGFTTLNGNTSEVQLGLPVLTTNLLIEQTGAATSSGGSTDARLTAADGTITSSSGGVSGAAAVDSDPSSAVGQTQTQPMPPQVGSVLTASGLLGDFRVNPTSSDTGNARAGIAADTTMCQGGDPAGTGLTTGANTGLSPFRPCASADVKPAGTAGAIVYDEKGKNGLGAVMFNVATMAQWPSSGRAVAAQLTSANPGQACTAGAGPSATGCAHAHASRSLGDISVGQLPGIASMPAGWNNAYGSFLVTGVTEDAYSEAGPTGARAPSYTRTGTIKYWNGAGYTSVNLATTSGPFTAPLATSSYTNNGKTMTITVSSTLQVAAGVSTPSVVPLPCTTVCSNQATGQGLLIAHTYYTVKVNGVLYTSFVVVTDLGGLLAQASFKAAPVA